MTIVKEEARKIIDHLPDNANWDDLIYEIYVRKKIEKGLDDIENGRTIPFEKAKRTLLER